MIDQRDIHLPRRTEAVAAARDVVGELAAWLGPRSDDAKLLVSELVTNALKYGAGDIRLKITGDDDAVRFVVCDDGAATGPRIRSNPGIGGSSATRCVARRGAGAGAADRRDQGCG